MDSKMSKGSPSKVAGESVHSPMGALKIEKTTDTSSFVSRDRELGISVPSASRKSNEARKG